MITYAMSGRSSPTREMTSGMRWKNFEVGPMDLRRRDARAPGTHPDRLLGDSPADTPTPSARVRPSGGAREEAEDPQDVGGQATHGVVRMGFRGPRRGVPPERTPEDHLPGDAAGPGPP